MKTCNRCGEPKSWIGGHTNRWDCRNCARARARAQRTAAPGAIPVIVRGARQRLAALLSRRDPLVFSRFHALMQRRSDFKGAC